MGIFEGPRLSEGDWECTFRQPWFWGFSGYRYVNWNTRSHFFTVSGLVVMSLADFIRNCYSPVLIKMTPTPSLRTGSLLRVGSAKRRGLSLLDFSSAYPPLEKLSTGNTTLGQEWKAPIGPCKSTCHRGVQGNCHRLQIRTALKTTVICNVLPLLYWKPLQQYYTLIAIIFYWAFFNCLS